MKNSNNKKAIAGLFAILSGAGAVHADDGMFRFNTVPMPQYQNTIGHLLQQGIIYEVPGKSNWYRIDQQQLNNFFVYEQQGSQWAKGTVDMLKGIVGDQTDVTKIDWLNARMGTQDVSIGFGHGPDLWDLNK
ncbi:hypothetical protein K2X30_12535 [bacterium]|jgi:hypothetical protein|nr:hypothetical protein [bacterium]